ncbi:hypothetical protein GAMM_80002 [Gammaproteobacteria bacterium]
MTELTDDQIMKAIQRDKAEQLDLARAVINDKLAIKAELWKKVREAMWDNKKTCNVELLKFYLEYN